MTLAYFMDYIYPINHFEIDIIRIIDGNTRDKYEFFESWVAEDDRIPSTSKYELEHIINDYYDYKILFMYTSKYDDNFNVLNIIVEKT